VVGVGCVVVPVGLKELEIGDSPVIGRLSRKDDLVDQNLDCEIVRACEVPHRRVGGDCQCYINNDRFVLIV